MPTDYRGFSRRQLLAGTAAGTALLAMPSIIRAETQSLKIAVLLPQSGYLAQAGRVVIAARWLRPRCWLISATRSN